ncbi:hypothetical protein EDEG_01966 [Edhazardia aedis USNM 41457]|uniref:Uncharacterized protein n=1 Tax=Edhazardia aedis (strain USNM 41457) TaxID=1003232 RepID=J8ZVP0_EDHAE|nr:hypothetical protein EDEG_01966 [Edhazardia aedis USNM 41457]|eukprot:EJW03728.1 hypothetical protein EDEG_01966 [Edhazardia aedis USNM 41457]
MVFKIIARESKHLSRRESLVQTSHKFSFLSSILFRCLFFKNIKILFFNFRFFSSLKLQIVSSSLPERVFVSLDLPIIIIITLTNMSRNLILRPCHIYEQNF